MKKLLTMFLFVFTACNMVFAQNWGLWGADRSYIGITVGATVNNKVLWNTTAGNFQGSNLGTLTSPSDILRFEYWDVKTWKNGGDVTGIALYFTIYETGSRPATPVFTQVNGSFMANLDGSGNQKWGVPVTTPSTISQSSLLAGKNYTIEIYIEISGSGNPVGPIYDRLNDSPATNYTATFSTDDAYPVELSSFSANVKGTSVVLNWATASEINNYGFEVEKSRDKLVWEKIGFVNGAGNSNVQKQYSFTDEQKVSPKAYYRLKQVDNDGTFEYSQMIEVSSALPKKFALNQNFPNPFNPETKISFSLPQAADVTLKVYNVLGNEVATVISGERMEAGEYSYNFRAGDLASGLYIYTLKANGMVLSKKMTLVK